MAQILKKKNPAKVECLHSHLCEVLQPWWDPCRNRSGPAERRRGDGSRVTSVLWSWNRTGLVHDNRRLAWIVAHVEARRRGLRVSVPPRARRVRSHHVAAMLSHGVRHLAGRAWITWKTHNQDQVCFTGSEQSISHYFQLSLLYIQSYKHPHLLKC